MSEELDMKRIKAKGIEVVKLDIYEPCLDEEEFNLGFHSSVIKDLEEFKNQCDIIVANRFEKF